MWKLKIYFRDGLMRGAVYRHSDKRDLLEHIDKWEAGANFLRIEGNDNDSVQIFNTGSIQHMDLSPVPGPESPPVKRSWWRRFLKGEL